MNKDFLEQWGWGGVIEPEKLREMEENMKLINFSSPVYLMLFLCEKCSVKQQPW